MPREKAPLSRSTRLGFISEWRSLWSQLLSYCEGYWKIFVAEGQKEDSVPADTPALGGVVYWCDRFQEQYGRTAPKSVGAAAVFRREFVRLTAVALPESGISLPSDDDPVEIIIALCPDWDSAIQVALAHVQVTRDAIQSVRPEWGVSAETDLSILLNYLQQEYETRLAQFEKLTHVVGDELSFKSFSNLGLIPIPTDPVFKVIIESLTYGEMKALSEDDLRPLNIHETFWRGIIFDTKETRAGRVAGVIGFQHEAEAHYRFLMENRSLAIKGHLALWARAYVEARAAPNVYLTVPLSQFCDDLGYKRKNGAYRAASKQTAVSALGLLTNLKMVGRYYSTDIEAPGEINDYIWKRGAIADSVTGYEDIFNPQTDLHIEGWLPRAFSYSAGDCFFNNTFEGLAPRPLPVPKLLRLSGERENKYAIILGTYLGILSQLNETPPRTIKVRALLEEVRLWATSERVRNPQRVLDHLENALDRLSVIGVIKAWDYEENLAERAEGSDEEQPRRYKRWYEKLIVITWPDQ